MFNINELLFLSVEFINNIVLNLCYFNDYLISPLDSTPDSINFLLDVLLEVSLSPKEKPKKSRLQLCPRITWPSEAP